MTWAVIFLLEEITALLEGRFGNTVEHLLYIRTKTISSRPVRLYALVPPLMKELSKRDGAIL